jgi:glycosyltransferase involved in cell wall biosynthesis
MEKQRILMLSWRDMKHPKKGGAEVVTDVYLSYLAKQGYDVTLFSSEYPNSKSEEQYNDYKIIRKGSQLTCHYYGLSYAIKNQKNFDVIIDQINTIPFFTPLFIKKSKRIAFFHQLCKNIWFYESSFPVAIVGYLSESLYLKLYKNTKAFTVSESSKHDLIKYAWISPSNILVLENQIDFQPITTPITKKNQFVFCGRLTKSKRVEDTIKALYIASHINNNPDNDNQDNPKINNININEELSLIKSSGKVNQSDPKKSSDQTSYPAEVNNINNKFNQQHPNSQQKFRLLSKNPNNKSQSVGEAYQDFNINDSKLYIIGNGSEKYKSYLKNLVKKLNLESRIIFTGHLSIKERNKIMEESLAILVTSVREGWGLIVTEANANKTIAITYNTEGLIDANNNNIGFITKNKQENTPKHIAEFMNIILKDRSILKAKSQSAHNFAKAHADWSNNTKELEKWLIRGERDG